MKLGIKKIKEIFLFFLEVLNLLFFDFIYLLIIKYIFFFYFKIKKWCVIFLV